MTTIYLTRTAPTAWETENRFDCQGIAPIEEPGRGFVSITAAQLADQPVEAVYVAPRDLSDYAVKMFAAAVSAKCYCDQDLRECDFGLWQGMALSELKLRQPRLYKQWKRWPHTVRPPGGEMLQDVRQRMDSAVAAISRKHKNGHVLLVLRPFALIICRTILEELSLEDIWRLHRQTSFTWRSYQINGRVC